MVVGHPFLLAHNQQKYVAMKHLDKDLRLRLVVPSRWQERFDPADCEVHPALSAKEVVPLKAHMTKSHMTYVHAPGRLAAMLRSFRPDVIHVEEEPQAMIALETIALRSAFAPRAAIALFTWDNILRRRRFPLSLAKRRLRAYSLRRASLVICGNRQAADLLRAEGRFRGTVEILPQYGLDVTAHQPGTEPRMRDKLGLQAGPVIGYVGRLVPEKGLGLLFEALAKLQNCPWKLLLVGAGPLEQEIRRRWMAMLPGRVVLVPAVSYEQVPRYLRCLDIFVLTSQSTTIWKEQFGLSLAQAMMLGIPCIGSTSGAIPEVLGPGGLLFQEGQSDDLRRHLAALLDSPALREQLGDQGRRFALQYYTVEGVGKRYLAAFDKALNRSSTLARAAEDVVAYRSIAS
ncbi:MAG TPA: glycosyltransferase family 4 protein [Terriglobales bacterium]|nr:glycosyltransferase family 4 protein [Terriglobales bacterium]